MSARTLGFLIALAAASVLLAVVGQWLERGGGSGSVDGAVGTTFLPGLEDELNAVERVEIVGAGGEPVATLERSDGVWTVAEEDSYPADVAKIRDALVALAEARILEEKTSNPAFYDRLGVTSIDDPEARGVEVRIWGDDREYAAVVLGDAASGNDRFARRADESVSYLIDRDPELPTTAAQWTRPEILNVASNRVQRVEIMHADGERLVISKSARDQANFTVEDIPEGRELQYATIANVTGGALRELRLEAVARLEDDPPLPAVMSEFRTFDGLVVTVEGRLYGNEPWVNFSARFDADQALAFAEEPVEDDVADAAPSDDSMIEEAADIEARVSGWRYRIPEYQYDQMTRRMDDLLRAPEEPDATE